MIGINASGTAKPIHLEGPGGTGRDFRICCDSEWHWVWPHQIKSSIEGVFVNDEGQGVEMWWTRDAKLATCETCRTNHSTGVHPK